MHMSLQPAEKGCSSPLFRHHNSPTANISPLSWCESGARPSSSSPIPITNSQSSQCRRLNTIASSMASSALMSKPFLAANGLATARPRAVRARANVQVSASARPVWLPGAQPPAHLNGSLAGDSGFDPLGLGVDGERLKWCVRCQPTCAFRKDHPTRARCCGQRSGARHARGAARGTSGVQIGP